MAGIDFAKAQVLITGGSQGIGLGLATRFLERGSRVLVTGRKENKLLSAKSEHPRLEILVNDIGIASERERLAAHVVEAMPALDVVINNAGIQRRVSLADDQAPWGERQKEIDVLLAAPIHLNHLLIPHLLQDAKPSMIVNVTSGGAFVPQPFAPIYSASKAALHSYTMNLRFALAPTRCAVVEVIPPAVQTQLGGTSVNQGAPLDEFCDAIFAALIADLPSAEIGFGGSLAPALSDYRNAGQAVFAAMAGRFPIKKYG